MPTVTLYPASFDANHAYYSATGTNNPIGKGSDSTVYARIYLTTGAGKETYAAWNFDTSAIPEDATILSVTCTAKPYISTSSGSYVKTRKIQLYSGNTAKGSAYDVTTRTTAVELSAGTWTRDELKNAKIRLYAQRGTSNTGRNYYFLFYGAELQVEYEDNTVKHTVTVQAADGITTDKSGETLVKEGTPFSVSIYGEVGSVTDNSVDITNQLTSGTIPPNETVTRHPASCSATSGVIGDGYKSAIGKGADADGSGKDTADISNPTETITYNFDFSDIPVDATIESVQVAVGGHCEIYDDLSAAANLRLYSGNTAKGTQSKFTSTSKQIVTMDAGTWTRDELQQARLTFEIGNYGGLVNGVDFVVVYSTPESGKTYHTYTIAEVLGDHIIIIAAKASGGPEMWVQINGAIRKVQKLWRQENGQIVEVSPADLDQSAKYQIVT